ncbi:hypothetical protein CRUP_031376 [Coryphaenoides rupestris]|nr:hypothetical protein CRUP_031376 [Coryphaenoides rupestris]
MHPHHGHAGVRHGGADHHHIPPVRRAGVVRLGPGDPLYMMSYRLRLHSVLRWKMPTAYQLSKMLRSCTRTTASPAADMVALTSTMLLLVCKLQPPALARVKFRRLTVRTPTAPVAVPVDLLKTALASERGLILGGSGTSQHPLFMNTLRTGRTTGRLEPSAAPENHVFHWADVNQALRLCLGTTATGAEFGAVSALSINHDCSRLLCGFAKGQITMWDLANGKLLRPSQTPPRDRSTACQDVNQALRLCLGTTATGAEFGAVSALSINHDCSRLLCGFAKGQITMWDLANGKLLRTITDAHPPGTAVLHVKFTDDPTLAICNDSGGSVFELAFRRVMGIRSCDSRCLFSGSKGEVCCIEPLHTPPERKDHPIAPYSLLAMGSLTKVRMGSGSGGRVWVRSGSGSGSGSGVPVWFWVSMGQMNPSLKVWMTFPYTKSDPSSVPQLAWQFVPAQKTYNPVLAFCRGDTIHFLLVGTPEPLPVWISSRTLVLVDSQEQLQVVDRPSQEVLDQLDLEQVQLVYNSRHFKSLATGGNVSEALALVGEKACYESVSSYAGQILYLGTKMVEILIQFVERSLKRRRLPHLTTPLMRDLLAHYHGNGLMDSLERLIVHLDITSLDMQQVVQMCWENRLYDAMIYVFNRGMNDYITPLEVFDFLIRLHSAETSEEEEVFPFIRTLLHFDTREFLNVLALTFEDFRNDKQALEYQQRIVDILLKVMVDNPDFTPSQVGGLFTFLARQMAKPDNTLFVNRKLFDQVLEFLCCPDDDSRHTERQQVLLELLHVGGVVQFDEGSLLALAEKAELDNLRKVEVFSYIHNLLSMPGYSSEEKQAVWDKTLQNIRELVALDPSREGRPADSTVTLDPDLHEQQVGLLCRFDPPALQAFLETSQLYPLEAAVQVTEQYGHSEATAYLLEKKGDAHRAFTVLLTKLKRVLETVTGEGGGAEVEGGEAEDSTAPPLEGLERSLDDIIALCHRNSQHLNQQQRETNVTSSLRETGLEAHGKKVCVEAALDPQQAQSWDHLRCLYHGPSRLAILSELTHFHGNEKAGLLHPAPTGSVFDGEDFKLKLSPPPVVTEQYGHSEATAYLLEKKGDAHRAFTVLLTKLKRVLETVTGEGGGAEVEGGEAEDSTAPPLEGLERSLDDIIALCHRNSQHLNQQQREDPVYGKGRLAEIQGLILGMLDTFNYEQTLLETTTSLLNHDLHWSLAHLRSTVSRGLVPRQDSCNICLLQYKRRHDTPEEIVIFSCGHLYHCQCLQAKDCGSGFSLERPQQWSCFKCSSNQGGRGGTNVTSSLRETGLEAHGKKVCVEAALDPQQAQSWDHLRCLYHGPSRLAILSELTHFHGNEKAGLLHPAPTGSVFDGEDFKLKLSPPPVVEE